ncbi:MAG: hypothetical protein CJBNEKGG_03010 [Prosthecobacter sp.]|nr:hypothetical protein [Prosthecobacter sp.]
MPLSRLSICLVIATLLAGCKSRPAPEKPVQALAETEYFLRYIKPLFATRCVACHRGAAAPAGLSLVQRSGLFAPRKRDRAFVVPGDPSASLLLTSVEASGSHPRTIPRVRGTLTDWELGALHEWIEDGAFWPDNPDGFIQPVDPLLGKVQR